jgi:diguanylate cyclase (GGDEF)-like protein/PAS domain S-box-containing protein
VGAGEALEAGLEHEELLRFLYQAPVGIIQFDREGRIGLMNPMATQLLAPLMVASAEGNLFDLLEQCLPDLRSRLAAFPRRQGTVLENRRVHLGPRRAGGDAVWLSLGAVKTSAERFVAVVSDVTEQVAQERRARQADAWFTAIMRGADDYMFCVLDGLGRVTDWNSSGEAMTGWTAAEIVGRSFAVLYPPDAALGDALSDRLRRAARDGWDLDEGWRLRRDGTRYYGNCMVSVLDEDGPRRSFLLVARDVTVRRHAADELKRLATTDHLTGVTNRARFFELAEEEIERARHTGRPLSLLMIDADRFKAINDAHGHLVGDEALKGLARACGEELRVVDVLARLGGEEFAVLMPSCDAGMAAVVAERVRRAVSASPMPSAAGPLPLTASLGVAELRPEDRGVEDVLRRADRALYAAKAGGRDRVAVG